MIFTKIMKIMKIIKISRSRYHINVSKMDYGWKTRVTLLVHNLLDPHPVIVYWFNNQIGSHSGVRDLCARLPLECTPGICAMTISGNIKVEYFLKHFERRGQSLQIIIINLPRDTFFSEEIYDGIKALSTLKLFHPLHVMVFKHNSWPHIYNKATQTEWKFYKIVSRDELVDVTSDEQVREEIFRNSYY